MKTKVKIMRVWRNGDDDVFYVPEEWAEILHACFFRWLQTNSWINKRFTTQDISLKAWVNIVNPQLGNIIKVEVKEKA